MRLTFVHPAIGHRLGESYLRSWQMEPLPIAALKGLTPDTVETRFYDDRLEKISYDEATDAVVISVETYTAKRAYQIASEYRQRGVPVVMGGFHVTLVPEEASRYADAIMVGEAEGKWLELIDDLQHHTLKPLYQGIQTDLSGVKVDRSLFKGKRYLPIGLVETGRGCRFPCEFCAIQTFYQRSYRRRDPDQVLKELAEQKCSKKIFFFVDDNFAGNIHESRVWLPELAKLNIRWITQMSINAAHDESFLKELAQSGCKGVLIGFESLNEDNLKLMNKRFNTMKGGFSQALANLRKYGIAVYGTFVFGYDHDTQESFSQAVAFAEQEGMYIAAFNHMTPFPGTPLYKRLQQENRLRYEHWWLDDNYRYNEVPFYPTQLTPEQVTTGCVSARRDFYSWRSIFKRSWKNRSDFFMFRNFFPINALHRNEISSRNGYPLGDEAWQGKLLEIK
ncbi:B12-binding domain-containing radical SAM protein [Entomomonas sp. E2T0]|uniref:B12-binding domain-containing radical SAM protein n=1 Tax=Entomomonas sp. E2T0 TaxID=2930213 RepID=UPI0022283021|nr:radical SAM protein [Entomomonas sp. E2T0]UYZ83610.1 B12-binding domain-containing radical SAM protein [Entomomonas sp. E2T0]